MPYSKEPARRHLASSQHTPSPAGPPQPVPSPTPRWVWRPPRRRPSSLWSRCQGSGPRLAQKCCWGLGGASWLQAAPGASAPALRSAAQSLAPLSFHPTSAHAIARVCSPSCPAATATYWEARPQFISHFFHLWWCFTPCLPDSPVLEYL